MPINPTTLKALIDTQITNETVNFAITPAEVGGRMKDTIDYTTEQIASVGTGAQGPQGVQGPAGPLGPVGPAGLNWQGVWGDETAYFVDDAVSWNGASWFCILDTTLTVNPFPDEDTTHWALLASQGAQGAQGVQGPTGAQGPAGTPTFTEGSLNSNSQSIAGNPATTTGKITENFTRAYVSSSINNFLGLSNIGKDTGDFYVVQNKSTTLDLIVIPIDGTEFLQPNGFSAQVNFTIKPKTYARFTLADNDSGSAKTFMVEVINPLGASGGTQVTKTLKTSISSAELLNLSTTPKVILLNDDLTTIKIPISVYVFKNTGDNYTLNNNGFYFLNSANNVEATLYLQCLTTEGTGYYQVGIPYSNGNMSGVTRMNSYSLQASGGNPTGGTATLEVYVTYLEILL